MSKKSDKRMRGAHVFVPTDCVKLFSLLSFFALLRFDQPRATLRVVEGTLGRAIDGPNLTGRGSLSSRPAGRIGFLLNGAASGDLMFGLIDNCESAPEYVDE